MKKIIISTFLLIASLSMSGQTPVTSSEISEPIKVVQRYIQHMNGLRQTQNSDQVMSDISPKFVFVNSSGIGDFEGYKKGIDDMVENLMLNASTNYFIKIEKIEKTIIDVNTAVIICRINSKTNGVNGISETISWDSYVLVKENGVWKIAFYQSIDQNNG